MNPLKLSVFMLSALVGLLGPSAALATDNAGCQWSVYYASQEFGYNYYVRWHYEDASDFTTSFRNRIANAATKWNNVDRMLYFGFESVETSGSDVEIRWRDLSGGPYADKLAITTNGGCPRTGGTTTFNSAKPWYTGTLDAPAGKFDALSVALHEWGHEVTIGHSLNHADDVMWATIADGEEKRSLTTHDKSNIQYMYGPAPYGGT